MTTDGKYKSIAVLASRVLYFISNMVGISSIFGYDGSLLFPAEDFTRSDAAFTVILFALLSFFTIRFAFNNSSNKTNEMIVLGSSIILGILFCFPFE